MLSTGNKRELALSFGNAKIPGGADKLFLRSDSHVELLSNCRH